MSAFQPFPCGECGNSVTLSRGVGRTREYVRGYRVPIPDDFEIPTCTKCGELYVVPEIEKKLNNVLRRVFLRMQAEHYRELVDILLERHGITQREVVRACAITPSYLSHVLAGKRQASATLTRLLEAFTADNCEFERHLANRPWTRTIDSVPLYAVKRHRGTQWNTCVAADKLTWTGGDAPEVDVSATSRSEDAA